MQPRRLAADLGSETLSGEAIPLWAREEPEVPRSVCGAIPLQGRCFWKARGRRRDHPPSLQPVIQVTH